jgi:hypothetical protein
MGNWPDMEPVINPCGYKEFLPDSILRDNKLQQNQADKRRIKFNDEI